MLKCQVFLLLVFAGGSWACQGHKSDGQAPTPMEPPTPGPGVCVEKQRLILEQSGWNLTDSLAQVIDALLQKKSTSEELPVCTT